MRPAMEPGRQSESSDRSRKLLTVAVSFLAGVAATISVMLIADGDPAVHQDTSAATTVPVVTTTDPEPAATTTFAEGANSQTPLVERTDLNTSETSFGTLSWTRISGDSETVPSSRITQSSDGRYLATEGNRRWHSQDGISWANERIDGLGDVKDSWIEDDWAVAWSYDSGTAFAPAMTRLFRFDDEGWTEVELPIPPLPDIDGISWSIGVDLPIESDGVTVAQASAFAEIPWGDHYGVSELPCGANRCERGPFSHMEQDGVWTLVPASGGSALATVAMTVTSNAVEFHDTATDELVHVIEATEVWSAQQIADALASGSMRVNGVFVDSKEEAFAFHETPFEAQFNQMFAVADGGFAAIETLEQDFGKIDARIWTSEDAVAWEERGVPAFLQEGARWIDVDTRNGDVVARMILDHGSASGEEAFESFVTTNGVEWTAAPPSQFPLFTRFHDANFGRVAIAMPQSSHQIWVSIDGDNWEQVEGPPGPHSPDGGGMSDAGAAGDILWVLVVENSGPRTLWIGTFE